MEKILICTILMALLGCSNDFVQEISSENNKEISMSIQIERPFSKHDFENLHVGTSYSSIQEQFGDPDVDLGSGFLIVGYYLEDGTIVELNFGTGKEGLRSANILERDADMFNKTILESIEIN